MVKPTVDDTARARERKEAMLNMIVVEGVW
jgi:hypothetical protein